ncbi:MAG: EF-P lysine aminoacylase EpmA [Xanthomonadales bacterium]|nr:EF-P lysine aminoacylase EpmA [Xanthomonadales bacterium]
MVLTDNWRPSANPAHLRARACLLRDIRDYFAGEGVMEVETPMISMAGNTDPEIHSIRTDSGGYLRTSPEFALKRLLASGSGDIFELGRVFRAGESGRSHNPEFTMLEWYRTGFSYHQLMDEVALLVRHCGRGKFDQWPQHKLSYRQLFVNYIGLDPFSANEHELKAKAKEHGISDIELNHRQWLDLLISMVIQPALPKECLTFIYDFPAEQAALARIRPGNPSLAERFELYLGQTELANGYQELTDAIEQKQRFDTENRQRVKRGLEECAIDHHLLSALENGLPECAGVALGVDRLLMAVSGVDSINKVTAFPYSRA